MCGISSSYGCGSLLLSLAYCLGTFSVKSTQSYTFCSRFCRYLLTIHHIIFFLNLQLMMARVKVGEELMPHRNVVVAPISSQPNQASEEVETAATTPIRKFSRNRGLVLQEQIVEDSPESDDSASRAAAAGRKSKRKRKLV